jgi:hypothetical protein
MRTLRNLSFSARKPGHTEPARQTPPNGGNDGIADRFRDYVVYFSADIPKMKSSSSRCCRGFRRSCGVIAMHSR